MAQLIAAEDHIRGGDTSELAYHLRLIELLTACTEGKNANTEVRCQALMPLEDIVRIVSRPTTVLAVKKVYVEFVNHCYRYVRWPHAEACRQGEGRACFERNRPAMHQCLFAITRRTARATDGRCGVAMWRRESRSTRR